MSIVKSYWTTTQIDLNNPIQSSGWAGAGIMRIPAGYLMLKNDSQFLYVALDLIDDLGDDAGKGDYFWFGVDVDKNRQISPYRDIMYGLYPGQPNRLARCYCIGPSTWTTILNEPSDSMVKCSFESSTHSTKPHRVWKLRLDLKEMGITYEASTAPQIIRFGLRTASSNPYFVHDFPAGYFSSNENYAKMNEIVLAKQSDSIYPPGTAGIVIGGIGNIPATSISPAGKATTAPSYTPRVVDAAFGGTLHFKGNRVTLQNLWNQGARKYKVLHRFGTSESFVPLKQTWSNYRWTGSTFILESFGADSTGKYILPVPTQDYSIDDLLLQWNSYGFQAGLHQFHIQFYRSNGALVASPPQILSVFLDNNLPQVKINSILHNNTVIPPCGIVHLQSSDGIKANITAYDPEGNLYSFSLDAFYGSGQSKKLYGDSYLENNHQNTMSGWKGVENLIAPSQEWVPPISCAYQLRLSAVARTTNGYSYIGYTEDTHHVTLMVPSATEVIIPRMTFDYLLGQEKGTAKNIEGT